MRFRQHYNWLRLVETGWVRPPRPVVWRDALRRVRLHRPCKVRAPVRVGPCPSPSSKPVHLVHPFPGKRSQLSFFCNVCNSFSPNHIVAFSSTLQLASFGRNGVGTSSSPRRMGGRAPSRPPASSV